MGVTYSAFRRSGTPTQYMPNKTAVTSDVTEAGFIFAFAIIAFSFLLIIGGIRGSQRVYSLIRFVIAMFIGAGILLSLWGQEWEKAEIHEVETAYKAFFPGEIVADIGVKIGLNSVNITLKANGTLNELTKENIDYNERFNFYGSQGRIGFGRFSGLVNREFREAQWSGKPYPILWIAEYFTLDGEGIRWGRSYRTAGYYTWIMVWTAFPLWILAMALSFMVLRYCGYFLIMTGGSMIIGNILYVTVRFASVPLKIPFNAEKILVLAPATSFYLCLIAGLVAIISGCIIVVMDIRFPNELSTFFNIDPLADYEETFVYDHNGGANGNASEAVVESKPIYRQRTASRFAVTRRRPRTSLAEVVEEANGENSDNNAPSGEKSPMSGSLATAPESDIPLQVISTITEEAAN